MKSVRLEGKTYWSSILLTVLLVVFTGCNEDKDYYDPNYAPQVSGILNFFDFKSTVNVFLDFTLDKAEAVTYKVYIENPFEILESGSIVMKEGLSPITLISTTTNGTYSGTLTLPTTLDKIFLYAYDPSEMLVGEISGSTVIINEDYNIWGVEEENNDTKEIKSLRDKSTRETIEDGMLSKFNILTLTENRTGRTWYEKGAWPSYGLLFVPAETPNNAKDTKGGKYKIQSDEAKMYRDLYSVTKKLGFQEGKTPTYDLQHDIATDLVVEEDAEFDAVKITFVGGYTGATNLLAYYCYDGNRPPTAQEIVNLPKGLIFFNAIPEQYDRISARIYSGMTVTLKPIKKDGTFDTQWRPGTKIGFVCYNNKNSKYPMFSTPFNNKKFDKINGYCYGCCATIPYKFTDNKIHILVGMDDWDYEGGGDKDMNDLIFKVHGVTTKLPPIVTTGEQMESQNKGLLIFEDNWPSMGDYDLNDLVITYDLKKTYDRVTTIDNNTPEPSVTTTYSNPRFTDTFVMKHYGANYDNSFAYEINLGDNTVDESKGGITITRDDRAEFDYEIHKKSENNYIIYLQHYVKTNGFGIQHNVQALDFWNTPQANKEITYTVTVPLMLKSATEAPIFPNLSTYFNPFLLKYSKDNTSGNDYSMEIHCIGNPPSHPNALSTYDNLATKGENNTGKSDLWPHTGEHEWYAAKDNFPFAIHFNADADASILNFRYPDEQEKIGDKYPDFKDWANSGGKEHTNWWK